MEYKSREAFLEDVRKLRQNAERYNGEENPVSQTANNIENVIRRQIIKFKNEIEEVEVRIRK